MYKKTNPKQLDIIGALGVIPHCDPRILHAPGECIDCDTHPDWQALRQMWRIAFTGYTPEENELPCPADHARGDSHKNWHGNVAQPKEDNGEGTEVQTTSDPQ